MKKKQARKKLKANRRKAFIRNERRASMAVSVRRQLGLGPSEWRG
jgi:hypothetical protein